MSLFSSLTKGAPERKSLDKLQREITETQTAIKELEGLPVHIEETRERLLSAVKDAVHLGVPEVAFQSFRYNDPNRRLPIEITFADLCFFFGEEVLINAAIKRMEASAQGTGIRSEERIGKMKVLHAKLDSLERSEELETMRLEDAGHMVLRRGTARPELLLAIWGEVENAKS